MELDTLRMWTDIVASVATTLAIVAAAWWFFVTTKYKPRIQFDLECNFITLSTDFVIAELQFIFENKGFIEHKLYNLNVAVHSLESEEKLQEKDNTKELVFKKRLLPRVSIVPKPYRFYFVRPETRQVITHIIKVPASLSVIRVTASFDYVKDDKYPHTARRVFNVSDQKSAGKQVAGRDAE